MYLPKNREPGVLVSILNWNNSNLTRNCVLSVKSQTYTNFQIVVIDNDSKVDPVDQLIEEFPDIDFVKSLENLGYAGGHQLAVEYAINSGTELVWLLNNDVSLGNDSLKNLVDAYLKNGKALYGSIPKSSHPVRVWKVDGNKPKFEEFVDVKSISDPIIPVTNLFGSSILIPIEVIKKHGFMDTHFFLYGEETDYCLRLLKKGIHSYLVRDSVIDHQSQASTKGNRQLEKIANYYRIRNHLFLTRRHQSFSSFFNLSLRYLQFEVIKLLKHRKVDPLALKSILDSWAGRTGKTLKPEDFV